jgi:hypothetical protein
MKSVSLIGLVALLTVSGASLAAPTTCPSVASLVQQMPMGWSTVPVISADYQPADYQFIQAQIIAKMSFQNQILCSYQNDIVGTIFITTEGRYKPTSNNWGGYSDNKTCNEGTSACQFLQFGPSGSEKGGLYTRP